MTTTQAAKPKRKRTLLGKVVMRIVFGRTHDDLAKHWVLNATLNHYDNGFIHFVADDFAD